MQTRTLPSKSYTLSTPPRRVLVIAMRYLGDLLLTTPLLHSIRKAYPECQLDVLAFENAAGMLEGNPDIDQVITSPLKPNRSEYIALLKKIFRRYDLAFITETGDRRFFYGLLSAPVRVGFAPPKGVQGHQKKYLVQAWVEDDSHNSHRVLELLRLAHLVGIPASYNLVTPTPTQSQSDEIPSLFNLSEPYVVLHPFPQWRYKRWPVSNWIQVGDYLRKYGLKLVLSCGPSKEETDYVEKIYQQLPKDSVNLAGKASLAQLAGIISRARLFIGPDTGITHLAAATGIPVIAIYGPTNPVRWAPWPANYNQDSNPFQRTGSQRVNNIFLIQGEADCVPCDLEGCEGHRQSYSKCLDELPAGQIEQTIQMIMEQR